MVSHTEILKVRLELAHKSLAIQNGVKVLFLVKVWTVPKVVYGSNY